ncbi:Lariat debranching enzyme [Coccomyxa sp. Obi]|nr:Lariat debranching enzyme [Coccomyxa sp. Obi]
MRFPLRMSALKDIRTPANHATRGLRIAVEGCCHGDLDKIYATMQHLERKQNTKIDLLICCGDFQAVRNLDDLECLACPPKYRDLKTFYRYYTGQEVAPYPTLFIGGNHEASNHLWELYHGGWAAPNIYYLGHAGVINFGGARIAGLSGIYNAKHYRMGHYERPPYQMDTIRSAYHVRELEVYRLKQLRQPIDVFLSHDWPRNIARHGDTQRLVRAKPFLRSEIDDSSLGSPPAEDLLKTLQPSYWFSAHLHVKFAALYRHDGASTAAPANPGASGRASADGPAAHSNGAAESAEREIQMDGGGGERTTAFLALDKCLPGRGFLQVVELPDAVGPKVFSYDEEWLAILRTTHSLLSIKRKPSPLPGMGALRRGPNPEDVQYVREAVAARGGPEVPQNFTPTVPGHDGRARRGVMPSQPVRNPQTLAFLEMLGLPYNLDDSSAASPAHASAASAASSQANPEEIDIDNPEEIELEEEGDDGPSALDESPPDALGPSTSAQQQESVGPPEQEASMFATVEIHSGGTSAAVESQSSGMSSEALPTPMSTVLQNGSRSS